MKIPSAIDLDAYCAPLRDPTARTELAARSGLSAENAGLYLDAVCNEAQTGLRLLEWAGLQPADRVLEVGAGGGLLSGFLRSRGIDLVAIEPTGDGFEATPKLAAVISEASGVPANILPLSAREIEPRRHGFFDLIFSVNVIEHFRPINENLDALAHVMGPRGTQVHTCPNYHVPYEPHYGIPLLPFAPRFTPFLGKRRSESVWRSLNFVTSTDLRAYARRFGLTISFKPGTLGETIERLCAEPAFAARHPRTLYLVARVIKAAGLSGTLRRLPPSCVTPMTVILRRLECPLP
jgi:2-polyprenyl-3-methyl-5-hydroxy-6-metoxy-1,4-benzoquinol methylase